MTGHPYYKSWFLDRDMAAHMWLMPFMKNSKKKSILVGNNPDDEVKAKGRNSRVPYFKWMGNSVNLLNEYNFLWAKEVK